jgi:dihydrofolate reductase
MRKLIASVHTTLDGYVSGPDGELDWLMPLDDDGEADISRMLDTEIDTILLGPVTYEGFTQFWPTAEGAFAELMNKNPKIVFSRPGRFDEGVGWGDWDNATLVEGDREEIREHVDKLKTQDGRDMVILSSAGLVSSFLDLGLIDELRVQVHPFVLGRGKQLFQKTRRAALDLVDVKRYPTGPVLMTYRVDNSV